MYLRKIFLPALEEVGLLAERLAGEFQCITQEALMSLRYWWRENTAGQRHIRRRGGIC